MKNTIKKPLENMNMKVYKKHDQYSVPKMTDIGWHQWRWNPNCVWAIRSQYKKNGIKIQICALYAHVCKYKGISEKYIGKYAREHFLLSFLTASFNQFNSFARLLHFNALSRDTHITHHKRHIAIWQYGHMTKIWPYAHMQIWSSG